MLSGLKVAVDVQHLYKIDKPNDRGSVYTLANGLKVDEASATLQYAAALIGYLRDRGAEVLTNDPDDQVLLGYYSTRNRAASAWGAHLYLACHVNAGGGDYSLCEFVSLTLAKPVAEAISECVHGAFPEAIGGHQVRALSAGDRGMVCIQSVTAPTLAVICEPLFGDRRSHQLLFTSPNLKAVGEAIGLGVSSWWRQSHT